MKFNWGWGILIFLVIFMSFMLNMVYRCTQQRVDLVSEKYYENELKYQQRIDMQKNTAALEKNLKIVRESEKVQFEFPVSGGSRSGQITFFKPDDARQDFVVPVSGITGNSQEVNTAKMKKGWWNVQVQWTQDGQPFYSEQKVLID